MHKHNMDKKKKNEEDKDLIDFMELIEDNLVKQENDCDVSDVSSCLTEEKLSDVRPLNGNHNDGNLKPQNIIKITNNFVDEELATKKAIQNLFSDTKNIDSENLGKIDNTKSQKTNLENVSKSHEKEEEVFCKSYKEVITNLENLNIKIEKMAKNLPDAIINNDSCVKTEPQICQNILTERSLTLHGEKSLQLYNEKNYKIRKFPGYLFVIIYSIDKYVSSDMDVNSVFIKTETKDFVHETSNFAEDSNIKINDFFYIKVENSDTFKIKFILNKKMSKNTIKSSECNATIDKRFLDKIHNSLYEVNYEWQPYSSNSFFKNLMNFFSTESIDALGLKVFFSFISEEEMRNLLIPIPDRLYSLGKWLKIRKYSYDTWFSGFCNIKGLNLKVCTHLWKRRFIKIHGYKILIFNEFTKNLCGIYDLLKAALNEREIILEDKKVKISTHNEAIELHFECNDKFLQFRKIMEALL